MRWINNAIEPFFGDNITERRDTMVKMFDDENEMFRAKCFALESGACSLYFLSLITAYLRWHYIALVLFATGTILVFIVKTKGIVKRKKREERQQTDFCENHNETPIFYYYDKSADSYEENVSDCEL